jgi:hypothetical protein
VGTQLVHDRGGTLPFPGSALLCTHTVASAGKANYLAFPFPPLSSSVWENKNQFQERHDLWDWSTFLYYVRFLSYPGPSVPRTRGEMTLKVPSESLLTRVVSSICLC